MTIRTPPPYVVRRASEDSAFHTSKYRLIFHFIQMISRSHRRLLTHEKYSESICLIDDFQT